MAFAVVFYGRNGGCLLLALTLRVLRRAARLQCNVTAQHTFVKARYRGGFMSANSCVQQFSMGLATYVSGQIMGQTPQGELTHFPLIGLLSLACTFAGISLSRYLKPAVQEKEELRIKKEEMPRLNVHI